MCVVSAVYDDWNKWNTTPVPNVNPLVYPQPQVTEKQIEDLIKRILEAREQDKAEGNPDCGVDQKKESMITWINEMEDSLEAVDSTLEGLRAELEELRRVVEEE